MKKGWIIEEKMLHLWELDPPPHSLLFPTADHLIGSYLGVSLVAQTVKIWPQRERPGFDPLVGKIPGEGNSNLFQYSFLIVSLQYSYLENPMDRGERWAIGHGIARSWTPLSDSYIYTYTIYVCVYIYTHTHTHIATGSVTNEDQTEEPLSPPSPSLQMQQKSGVLSISI